MNNALKLKAFFIVVLMGFSFSLSHSTNVHAGLLGKIKGIIKQGSIDEVPVPSNPTPVAKSPSGLANDTRVISYSVNAKKGTNAQTNLAQCPSGFVQTGVAGGLRSCQKN